ncbi:MAG: alpha-aminoadipate--LysW ligase LysX [Candidatus Parcubacteria bacterium]|nr:MAG: alpha-aminoadipate--LysW ligase LysX [Candidatus Parcubacteria bacterium]
MIALIYNLLREDEKFLIESAKKLGVDLNLISTNKLILNPSEIPSNYQLILNRCLSNFIGDQITHFFENFGLRVINSSQVNHICSNKFLTSLFLIKNNLPTVPFLVFFNEELIDQVVNILNDYPLVLKPVYGSWGRLLAKINDKDAFEGIIEHKKYLSAPYHNIFYTTKYIEKPNRDIRVTIIGEKIICAVYRENFHWISNTARGGKIRLCQIDKDLENLCQKLIQKLPNGIYGVDVFEFNNGYLINELNHTVEFKNIQKITGISISDEIIKFCLVNLNNVQG